MKTVIGLTGSIASGKSTVANEFRKYKFIKFIDSDKIVHEIEKKGTGVYRNIVTSFGKGILLPNGEIDRKKLAGIIFSDFRKRKKLEEITHPAVIKVIKQKIKKYSKQKNTKLIVVDIPLLFEKKLQYLVNKIVVAWTPKKVQLERLMKRDFLTKKEALKRLNSQLSLDFKKKHADFVVDTSKSIKEIKNEVKKIVFFSGFTSTATKIQ